MEKDERIWAILMNLMVLLQLSENSGILEKNKSHLKLHWLN